MADLENASNPYEPPNEETRTPRVKRVYRDSEDEFLDNSAVVRALGALVLALGLWAGTTTVLRPIKQAFSGETSISYHSKGVMITLVTTAFGTIMLLLGRHTRAVLFHRWYNATALNVTGTALLATTILAATIKFEPILSIIVFLFS